MAFEAEHSEGRQPGARTVSRARLNLGVGRRSDLDWLRVIAFGLLILFHAGLVYAPFDWHIHSRHTQDWLRWGIYLTGPWRLTLLFFISGCALRLMSRKLSAWSVLKARLARLLPPALFGVLVLVPPQAWLEAVDKGSWHEGLIAWWIHQFSPAGLASGVPVNHIWFVIYILVYSMLATALIAVPVVQKWISGALGWSLSSLTVLVLPILYLAVVRQGLFPHYGVTNHLDADWYNHAMSFGVFLLGFLVVGENGFWRAAIRWRWAALTVAALALPALIAAETIPSTTPEAWWLSLLFSVDQWATIAAILGFGAIHLQDRDGPLLRYLSQAVFPCYLAHQTILVCAVWFIRPLNLPALLEAPILVGTTVGGCLVVYEIVRRFNLVRPLWGLKPLPPQAPEAAPTVAPGALPRPAPARPEAPALTAEAA
jgi:peptidoglycan/LPS O-acetylase OafA/YrhL